MVDIILVSTFKYCSINVKPMRYLTKKSKLFATFLLVAVSEDSNQKLEEEEDDFNATEDGKA